MARGRLVQSRESLGLQAADGSVFCRRFDEVGCNCGAHGRYAISEAGLGGVATIAAGTTLSYGELAKRIGQARASRAVGLANGSNPIAIVVPCHRVIGSTGALDRLWRRDGTEERLASAA